MLHTATAERKKDAIMRKETRQNDMRSWGNCEGGAVF